MNDEEINSPKKKERTGIKERRSYVILALVIIVMFFIFGAAGINYVQSNNRAWCEIIKISTPSKPPVKPANPYLDPTGERRYEGYVALIKLTNRFGCH